MQNAEFRGAGNLIYAELQGEATEPMKEDKQYFSNEPIKPILEEQLMFAETPFGFKVWLATEITDVLTDKEKEDLKAMKPGTIPNLRKRIKEHTNGIRNNL